MYLFDEVYDGNMEIRVKKPIEQMTTDFQQMQDLKLNLHLTEAGKEEMLNNYDRNMTTICLFDYSFKKKNNF